MRLSYKINEAASRLYRAGVSYYDYGTIKQGKTALFDYYKSDKVTDEQLAIIRQYCPDVQVKGVRSEYAPELRAVIVCFPKSAWYRQQQGSK